MERSERPSMTPPNGYYTVRVQYDTGGTFCTYVHVHDGVIRLPEGDQLLPESCIEFTPVTTMEFCAVWPSLAAKELDELRERMKRLEEALDIGVGASYAKTLINNHVDYDKGQP